jgi:DNA repair protein RadC
MSQSPQPSVRIEVFGGEVSKTERSGPPTHEIPGFKVHTTSGWLVGSVKTLRGAVATVRAERTTDKYVITGPSRAGEAAPVWHMDASGTVAQASGLASDYEVIGSSGSVLAGPFKGYGDAKTEADRRGGVVRYVFEGGAADYEALSSSGKVLGKWTDYQTAKKEADAAGGVVRFAFDGPEPSGKGAPRVVGEAVEWKLQGSSWKGVGAGTGDHYEIVPSVLTSGKRKHVVWAARVVNPGKRGQNITTGEGTLSDAMSVVDKRELGERKAGKAAEGASDFPSLEQAWAGAASQGATHHGRIGESEVVLWPASGGKMQARRVFYASGKHHIEKRAELVAPPADMRAIHAAKAAETVDVAHDCGCDGGASEAAAEPAKALPQLPYIHCTRNVDAYKAMLQTWGKLPPIKTPQDAHRALWPTLGKEDKEVFGVLLFDVRNRCIGWHEAHRGARDHVEVSAADVFAPIPIYRPHHYLVVHNHPTGKAVPSDSDIRLTKKIVRASEPWLPECVYVDHIIIGVDEVYSFRDKKTYPVPAHATPKRKPRP